MHEHRQTMVPTGPLPPAGESLLDALLASMRAHHAARRRRRRARAAAMLLAASGTALAAIVPATTTTRGPAGPGEAPPVLVEAAPDPAPLVHPEMHPVAPVNHVAAWTPARISVDARTSDSIPRLDDEALLDLLESMGRPTGLIRIGDRVLLADEVSLAAPAPTG
ncbi:MAG: hypothetical protein KF817_06120 [Phycisphaeraceae bacterium]|nr:hypothetical protein [Phycisphaeraceae bacterium]